MSGIKYLVFYFLVFSNYMCSAQVFGKDCDSIYIQAKDLYDKSINDRNNQDNSGLAIRKLLAYKTCSKDSTRKADTLLLKIYENIKQQKIKAIDERKRADNRTIEANKAKELEIIAKKEANHKARINYANDVASKSKIALLNGDRNKAIRLAEFAHKFIDSNNLQVKQSLIEAFYYNDNTSHPVCPRYHFISRQLSNILYFTHSSNGEKLAISSDDHSIKVVDIQSDSILKLISNIRVGKIEFIHHDSSIVGLLGNMVVLWSIYSKTLISDTLRFGSEIGSFAILSNHDQIVVGGKNGLVKIWSSRSLALIDSIEFKKSFDFIDMRYIPHKEDDSDMSDNLICCNSNGELLVWDLKSTEYNIIDKILQDFAFNSPVNYAISFINSYAISNDGKKLITLTYKNNSKYVYLWDIKTRTKLDSLPPMVYVYKIDFNGVDNEIAVQGMDGITIWNFKSKKPDFILPNDLYNKHPNRQISYFIMHKDKNRKSLILTTNDDVDRVKVWELDSAKSYLSFHARSNKELWSPQLAPNGKKFYIIQDSTVKIYETESGTFIDSVKHDMRIERMIFSQDSKLFATLTYNNVIWVWGEDLKLINLLKLPVPSLFDFNFKNNCDSILIYIRNNGQTFPQLAYWDYRKNEIIFKSLSPHFAAMKFCGFSKEGNQFATYSWSDNTVRFYDAKIAVELNKIKFISKEITYGVLSMLSDNYILFYNNRDSCFLFELIDKRTINKFKINLKDNGGSLTIFCQYIQNNKLACSSSYNTFDEIEIFDIKTGRLLLSITSNKGDFSKYYISQNESVLIAIKQNLSAIQTWLLTPELILKKWQKESIGAELTTDELQSLDLIDLLTIDSLNVNKLINTNETWQIKSFADLFLREFAGGNDLKYIEPKYKIVDQLYSAVFSLEPSDPLIRRDYSTMLHDWANLYQSEGKLEKAKELNNKADRLWKDENER